MARKPKKTLEDRKTPEPGQRTHRTDADKGVPEVWPPNPPEESSTIHDERTAQESDNTGSSGKVTSEGPIPRL